MNDDLRLLIMSTLQSLFPVLNLLGVISLTGDEISVVMVLMGNVVLLGARAFKKGQGVVR